MTHPRIRPIVLIILLALASLAAQSAEAARQARPAPAAQPPAAPIATELRSAEEIKSDLNRLLEKYPPAVGRMFTLDSSLLTNESYLAAYPALASFLGQHPDVLRNPRFYFGDVPDYAYFRNSAEGRAMDLWYNVMGGTVAFLVFIIVTAVLAWLVKTLADYRRWSRLSKVQAEVHNKLLDRFTANEDLLAYIQTPAGRRFLESAPIALDPGTPPLGAPLRRVLWAVEAGLVLAAGGAGLLFVSFRVIPQVAEPLFAIGVLAVALGIGFVLSAVVSFLLSKRLGLFDRPSLSDTGQGAATGT
jgi:hypothetical protein